MAKRERDYNWKFKRRQNRQKLYWRAGQLWLFGDSRGLSFWESSHNMEQGPAVQAAVELLVRYSMSFELPTWNNWSTQYKYNSKHEVEIRTFSISRMKETGQLSRCLLNLFIKKLNSELLRWWANVTWGNIFIYRRSKIKIFVRLVGPKSVNKAPTCVPKNSSAQVQKCPALYTVPVHIVHKL